MKKEIQEYQPVATAVPKDSGVEDDDNIAVASVAADDPQQIESADVVAIGLNEQQEEQCGNVPLWADPYFEGRQDVWGVFDFDSKASISTAFKADVMILIMFIMLAFLWGVDLSWSLMSVLFILSLNAHRAAVGTHTTRHLALTRDGLLFVHEKHRTWYGMKGYLEQLVPYAEINVIEPRYATGDVIFCFQCTINKIGLRKYHSICGDESGLLLDIEGVKEAKVLVDILHKLSDARIHGVGLSSPVPASAALEVPSGAHLITRN